MKLTDCIGQFTDTTLVGDANPGQHPPGWERQSDRPTNGVGMDVWKCQRVSWGTYERGPVTMLFESHTNADSPSKCRITATGSESILTSWWISDADLAILAQTLYHAPAVFASVNFTSTTVGSVVQHAVAWGLPGQGISHFEVLEGQSYSSGTSPLLRYFWFDGQVVHLMDQTIVQSLPQSAGELVTGKMYPPMMMAKISQDYVSQGEWYQDAHMDADFASFKDLQCSEPGP
jgi:hypothetical protein